MYQAMTQASSHTTCLYDDPGKPLFGTLISLLYNGTPVLGIIDQPILR